MKLITDWLIKLGILKKDLDYHLIRASMVVIFFFFGYQKWFDYEAQALIPYINHGPLIRNGCLGRSCSPGSGTRNSESLAPWAGAPASSRQPPSFRSCQMAGLRLPEGFPQ